MRRIINEIIIPGIAITIASILLCMAICPIVTQSELDYYAYADNCELIEIIDSNKLTVEALESRNGKLIIEKVIGVVDDAETGKGHVIDNADYYISYKNVKDIENGNVICTYFIYNPDTNYYDDIMLRFDYIID